MAEKWEIPRGLLEKEFRVVASSGSFVFHRCDFGSRTRCGVHWDYSLALPEARKEGMRPCKKGACFADAYEEEPCTD